MNTRSMGTRAKRAIPPTLGRWRWAPGLWLLLLLGSVSAWADGSVRPPVLDIALNAGAATTTERLIRVDIRCTHRPVECLVSESPTFPGANWQPVSSNGAHPSYDGFVSFTLSPSLGDKTVYAKVRTEYNIEAGPANDGIRLLPVPTRPSVRVLAINDGAPSVNGSGVTLNNDCQGSPTEYMASESPTFSNAGWNRYSTAPGFTLSPGNGRKVVYFKVRNAVGESDTVPDDIERKDEPRPPVDPNPVLLTIVRFAIADGAASTTSPVVTLNNGCVGSLGLPTQYQASESDRFPGANWLPYSASPTFTLSAGNGEKTVYFRVRNAAGETAVQSDTIRVAPPLPAIPSYAINQGAATTFNRVVTLNMACTGNPTQYRASESAQLTGATWQPYSDAPVFTLSTGLGWKRVYWQVRNDAGTSVAISDTIQLAAPPPPPVITLFSINRGAATTASRTVTLDNTATGGPADYQASESRDFTGAAWLPYATAPAFTLSPGDGPKTVYFKVRNAGGQSTRTNDSITVSLRVTLAEALDLPSVTWTTGGAASWSGLGVVTHDGLDAAESGKVGKNRESWVEATVAGPCAVDFWWKVSCEADHDRLRLLIDGVQVAQITGEVGWTQRSVELSTGKHTVRWSYAKDSTVARGSDRGWVDQVAIRPVAAKPVVHVDHRYTLPNADGTPTRPYPTVDQGYARTASGGVLKIRAGNYAGRFVFDRPLRLEAYDGTVKIGTVSGARLATRTTVPDQEPAVREPDRASVRLSPPAFGTDGSLALTLSGEIGQRYQVLTSADLKTWDLWQEGTLESETLGLTFSPVPGEPMRFFKVVTP